MKETGLCSKCGRPLAHLWPAFMLKDPGLMEIFRASSWVVSCVSCQFIASECPAEFLAEPVDLFGGPDIPDSELLEPFLFGPESCN
jgi:hypothetical protein